MPQQGMGTLTTLGRVRQASPNGLVHNVGALYGVHVARYLFPLVVVPYLARVLTPSGWGTVAFAQGFSVYLTLIVEYGFNLSATREVARSRDSRETVSRILAGVMGAKVLLALVCLLVSWLAFRIVPLFRQDAPLLWAATFASVAQAFSPLWLFQGLERMKALAILDVSGKLLGTVGVFVFVHSPADGWKVLMLQGLGSSLTVAAGYTVAYRLFPVAFPTRGPVLESLRMGWTMFIYRSSVSLYTVGNSFILGLFVAPQFVGYYAGAEKVSRAFVGAFDPLSQALFPRLSHLVHHARDEAQQLARVALLLMGSGGLLMSVCMFASAPFLVRSILGPGFLPSVAALRILSLLPFLIALSNVLGIQWMLPLGMDRAFNSIILFAGAINVTLAVILAPRYKHLGMAAAASVAEVFVTAAMFAWLKTSRAVPPSIMEPAKVDTASGSIT